MVIQADEMPAKAFRMYSTGKRSQNANLMYVVLKNCFIIVFGLCI